MKKELALLLTGITIGHTNPPSEAIQDDDMGGDFICQTLKQNQFTPNEDAVKGFVNDNLKTFVEFANLKTDLPYEITLFTDAEAGDYGDPRKTREPLFVNHMENNGAGLIAVGTLFNGTFPYNLKFTLKDKSQ